MGLNCSANAEYEDRLASELADERRLQREQERELRDRQSRLDDAAARILDAIEDSQRGKPKRVNPPPAVDRG
jgi:hypothetical protein